jgi:hypothetical protein
LKRTIKIIFYTLLAIIILIIGSGIIIGNFYEKDISNAILKELNKNIATKIEVKSINFSVLTKFPDASIEFNDVTAMSTHNFKGISTYEDTLLRAKTVFLQFNVLDIIKEHYTIKAIHIDDADVRIITNSDGSENFRFWRSDTTNSENFELKLNSIKLTKTELSYINRIKKIDLKVSTNKFNLGGDFTSNSYVLESKGSFKFDKLKIEGINYSTKDNITLNADIQVDDYDLTIKDGELRAEDLIFIINGKANIEDKLVLDLDISGEDINISSLLSTIPKEYRKNIDKYNSEGEFYFNGNINGELSNNRSPHLKINFGINNAIINNSDVNLSLYDVFVKGEWTNGNLNSSLSSELIIDSLYAKMNNSIIAGSYSMKNLVHPMVKMNLIIDADFSELIEFLSIDTINESAGRIKSKLAFDGRFNDLNNITNKEISHAKKSGYVSITNALINFKESKQKFDNINGGFSFNNKNIKIDSLSFVQGVNDIKIKGFLYNLFDYLLVDNKDLRISGTLESDNIDIDEFIDANNSNTDKSNETGYNIKKYINYNLEFYAKKIKFRKFVGKNLKGRYKYYEQKASLSNFNIKTMDGEISGYASLSEGENSNLIVNVNTSLINVEINKLLYSLDNFGQDFIDSDNLKGKISIHSDVSFSMNQELNIDTKSIVAEGDIIILNGELIEFKPIFSLSKFIKLEELKDIKFSKLENNIYIKNEKILIPRMKINSSAFDIDIEGRHLFTGEYEYKIRVLLSDLLSKKAKKVKKENTEFGVVEDDGLNKTSIYVIIKADANGKIDISYDKTRVKENIVVKYKEEKQNIKTILNEEFGWFKKDSTVIKKKEEEKDSIPVKKKKKVQIQWEDN